MKFIGGGQAGNNPKGNLSRANDEKMEVLLGCRYCFGCGWRTVNDVIYADGNYAVTRSCGDPIFSTDGIVWGVRTIGASGQMTSGCCNRDTYSIDYHSGLFVVGGYNCFNSSCFDQLNYIGVRASTDTYHWSIRTLADSNNSCSFSQTSSGGLKYINGLWYLLNTYNKNSLQVSTDSVHWVLRTTPMGGSRITWSGEHYAYYGPAGTITSSTDAIHWYVRTLAYMSSCSPGSDEGMLVYHNNTWITVTQPYIGACGSYAYASHIHTSTDTISWTLRTFPFNNSSSATPNCAASDINHHCISSLKYRGMASVGSYVYLNGCTSRCSTCECYLSDTYYMYAPLLSTDGIHWLVDTQTPNYGSRNLIDACYYVAPNGTQCYKRTDSSGNAHYPALFNVKDKLLLAGDQSYRGIVQTTEVLGGGGSGGSGANYSLFSIDPKIVVDRKLEINIGPGERLHKRISSVDVLDPELQYHTMLRKDPLVTTLLVMDVSIMAQVQE